MASAGADVKECTNNTTLSIKLGFGMTLLIH